MQLELKITCTCHQSKIAICCQTPLVATISPNICAMGYFNTDHYSNTSFKRSEFFYNFLELVTYIKLEEIWGDFLYQISHPNPCFGPLRGIFVELSAHKLVERNSLF